MAEVVNRTPVMTSVFSFDVTVTLGCTEAASAHGQSTHFALQMSAAAVEVGQRRGVSAGHDACAVVL